jgi:hypothetical protein
MRCPHAITFVSDRLKIYSHGLVPQSEAMPYLAHLSFRAPYAPQTLDATLHCNFYKPKFMVQPAENISRSIRQSAPNSC